MRTRSLKQRFTFERKFRGKGVIGSTRNLLINLIDHNRPMETLTFEEQITIQLVCGYLENLSNEWDKNTKILESWLEEEKG